MKLKKYNAQIIAVGDEKNVEARVRPSNATNQTIRWISDDESILSVAEYGNISGVSTGIATLTAVSVDGNYSDSFVVTVKEPTTDISALELEQSNVIVQHGQRFIIDYIVRPLNAVEYDIEIASRNLDIVSVDDNGILQANNKGQTEIEVKAIGADDDEYIEICTVTVDDGMSLEVSSLDNSLGIYSDMTFGGVSIDMKNKISETVNSDVYIAFYSSDGILLGLQKDSKELSVGNNKLEYNNLVINGEVETIKVFAWDSNMKPYSAIYETRIASEK